MFDRLDWERSGKDVIHLNLFAARNWIQIPNSYTNCPKTNGNAFLRGMLRLAISAP